LSHFSNISLSIWTIKGKEELFILFIVKYISQNSVKNRFKVG
jgi:hypothetical protein